MGLWPYCREIVQCVGENDKEVYAKELMQDPTAISKLVTVHIAVLIHMI